MGGKKLNKSNKSRRPRPSSGLFVEGGALSDCSSAFTSPPSRVIHGANVNINSRFRNGKKSCYDPGFGSGSGLKSEIKKTSAGIAIGYSYPQENQENSLDTSNPIVLIDSEKTQIIAYIDEGPVKETQSVEYLYDYTTSFTLGESSPRELGFYDEVGTPPDGIGGNGSSSYNEGDMSVDIDFVYDANAEETSPKKENPDYLLIGGTEMYTHDTSDEDNEDEEHESSVDESSESEDSSETSESDGSSYSGSDVDDEVAEDYFEGIGGISNVVNVDQLVGQISDDSSDSEGNIDETVKKLGAITLQEASKECGKKKPVKLRKENKMSIPVNYGLSSSLDDLMLVKDPRAFSGKKKHASKFPQSWPSEAGKSRSHWRMPVEKKKHRKELIAEKHNDRMIQRGVDLQKINLKLKQMVLDGVDMFSFQPMHRRDCTQLRRLAAIYRWQSECQGSGKKRFVTVVRTQDTCMPSSIDKVRLEQLIGANSEDTDFSVISGKPIKVISANTSTSKNKSNKNNSAKKSKTGKIGCSCAAQPLSFVSSGTITAEIVEFKPIESNESKVKSQKNISNSTEYGSFEMHTTGFGSKMMAKMGYVEGEGLGKDGQGMAQPIQVFQRPKSLGLGAK